MISLGAALFCLGIYLVTNRQDVIGPWCGMFGYVFMLHFGLLQIISCAWQTAGVDAQPIMNRPLSSDSLGEFWARWNRAFRDASYSAIFRPIARRHSAVAATWAVFLFSGIVHELLISVPGRGGYGLPILYFAIQGAIEVGEGRLTKRWPRWSKFPLGRILTLFVVFAPLPLLFHPPFVRNVIIPMLHAAGSTIHFTGGPS
jgi:alginate O-acetyltransferase complex protein AlgI